MKQNHLFFIYAGVEQYRQRFRLRFGIDSMLVYEDKTVTIMPFARTDILPWSKNDASLHSHIRRRWSYKDQHGHTAVGGKGREVI